MAATYEPIATTTLSSNLSTITFSSIPNTYTDLRLIVVAKVNNTGLFPLVRFNSDTSTNYSQTNLYANPAGIGSSQAASATSFSAISNQSLDNTIPFGYMLDILSYASSSYKMMLSSTMNDQAGSGSVERIVGYWRSVNAISSITMLLASNAYVIGTTATLYGIKKA